MDTVPWIINNMILESAEMTKPRRPSEVELKVQKSLQQLSVPDWYTNKCVASPKILVDRRPFESRPAPWKDPVRNCAPSKNPWKNSTANTAVVKPVAEEAKAPNSELEKLSEVMKVSSAKSPASYSSKTFPKISPSRKIRNINIVFPTTKPSPETAVESTNKEISPKTDSLDESIMSIDSLQNFTPQKTSSIENKPTSMTVTTPIRNSSVKPLSFQDTKKIERMNCAPPAPPKTPVSTSSRERINFLDQSFSTPNKFSDTEKILISPVNRSANTGSQTPQKKSNISRMNSPAPSPPLPVTPVKISGKHQSSFLENSSTTENLFTTPKKSTEMENIIKNHQKRSSGRSFVEEIIQELNAKCSPRVKSNYVSPTSKNFVKKLVRALEMGCAPKRDDDDNDDDDPSFGNCISDIECKSNFSSDTISVKDSDSGSGSDSEAKSSGSQLSINSTFRGFSKALEGHRTMSRSSIRPYIDDKNDSVYWIPLPTCKIPRTSSLKNMMCKLSSNSGISSPISSSPDLDASREESPVPWQPTNLHDPSSDAMSGWGKTFDKRQPRLRHLFRIDETNVIDSGYSDRSGTSSPGSSLIDESWYGDSETTQTASETSGDYENNYSNHLIRPREIPHHRQRTFVV